METSQEVWSEFMTRYSVTSDDLDTKYFSIDGHPQESLREIIVNNSEDTIQDILDVEYFIPLKEMFQLKIGEQYVSGQTRGNIVRIK